MRAREEWEGMRRIDEDMVYMKARSTRRTQARRGRALDAGLKGFRGQDPVLIFSEQARSRIWAFYRPLRNALFQLAQKVILYVE